MKQVLVGFLTLFLTTLVHAQSALDLPNLEVEVPSLEDMNSPPVTKGEKIVESGTCGQVVVTSQQSDGKAFIRTTYQKQRPVVIAFCWLDEIRARFNTAQSNARGTQKEETTLAFIRTVQLEAVSNPKSYYNRMKDTYCLNGGTFFMDLTNAVRECTAK